MGFKNEVNLDNNFSITELSIRGIENPTLHVFQKIEIIEPDIVIYFPTFTGDSYHKNHEQTRRSIDVGIPTEIAAYCLRSNLIFLAFSSTRVFDETESFVSPYSAYSPTTAYGKLKVELEKELLPLNAKILRLGKVLLPSDPIWQNWHRALDGKDSVVIHQSRYIAPIFVKEVVRAILKVITSNSDSQVFQFSRNFEISYLELFHLFTSLQTDPKYNYVKFPRVKLLKGFESHESLLSDTDLLSCLSEFGSSFKYFVEEVRICGSLGSNEVFKSGK
jgi:dTDP-4-dehydrorhamnose reductase